MPGKGRLPFGVKNANLQRVDADWWSWVFWMITRMEERDAPTNSLKPPAPEGTQRSDPQLRPVAVRVVHKLQHARPVLGVARRATPKSHTRLAIDLARTGSEGGGMGPRYSNR